MRVALTFDAEHPDRPNDGDRTLAVLDALADLTPIGDPRPVDAIGAA